MGVAPNGDEAVVPDPNAEVPKGDAAVEPAVAAPKAGVLEANNGFAVEFPAPNAPKPTEVDPPLLPFL